MVRKKQCRPYKPSVFLTRPEGAVLALLPPSLPAPSCILCAWCVSLHAIKVVHNGALLNQFFSLTHPVRCPAGTAACDLKILDLKIRTMTIMSQIFFGPDAVIIVKPPGLLNPRELFGFRRACCVAENNFVR